MDFCVRSALFVLIVLLFKVVESTAHHSFGSVLLDDWADGFMVVDLLLALHRLFDSCQFMLDSVLGG